MRRAAGILRGLFETLGGDPGYAKSVASMMRLPGSINTKPERGGAVAHFLELHPERRAPYDALRWLERQPERQAPLIMPWSKRERYQRAPAAGADAGLSGARCGAGSRNAELLAAACQFRDAGYSQTDAERELVPRLSPTAAPKPKRWPPSAALTAARRAIPSPEAQRR
ncbi:MAG: hypothetical protein IPK19_37855 [Chloroflexi bacterium]|nr:hypothetical protein [Chloroflexota bacterium]